MEFIKVNPIPAAKDYYDLGSYSWKVRTHSIDAQTWFDRGLIWAYSFNHEEAEICFQQVIAHDPACVMGYWGVAFALGPNYNKKWTAFDKADLKRTLARAHNVMYIAEQHLSQVPALERALFMAIKQRFPTNGALNDFDVINRAYATAMRQVFQTFGEDNLDVVALFISALMDVSPWELFESGTGKPNLKTAVLEVKDLLEQALMLSAAKKHPGILHMYIHLMEMSNTPQAALGPADHLRDLVPDSGHMRHMPTHLDILLGDYRRAVDCNMKATLVDDKFYEHRGGQNFYSLYRIHDYHTLIYAAMFAGQSEVALEATTRMELAITEDLLRIKSPPMADWIEAFKSVRVHVLIRFGRWEELKNMPIPKDKELYCVSVAIVHYGRAIAWAASGEIPQARREQDLFGMAVMRVPPSRMMLHNRAVDVFKVAASMLDGELEYRRANYDIAFACLRQAIDNEDKLLYAEPWSWMVPTRHAYAALLLEQGHVEEAAKVYAEDLGFSDGLVLYRRHPNNVWALHGYYECMMRLGRTTEARMVQMPLNVALAVADVPIRSSCFCRLESINEPDIQRRQCSKL